MLYSISNSNAIYYSILFVIYMSYNNTYQYAINGVIYSTECVHHISY